MTPSLNTKSFLTRYKKRLGPQQKKGIDWAVARIVKKFNMPFDWASQWDLILIGNWKMLEAAVMILEGAPDGWVKARESFYYRAWYLRILGGLQDLGRYNSFLAPDFALWIGHAIATHEDSFVDWFGSRIVASCQNKDTKFVWWGQHRFPPFIATLYARWRNQSIEFGPEVKLGVYQTLLDAWDSPKDISKALVDACDFHVKQARGEDGAFCHMPYDLAPFEILAIQRVRRDLGLPTPEIDHPLLQTPLARPPEQPPEFHDELLDKIIAKARAELPIGDPW